MNIWMFYIYDNVYVNWWLSLKFHSFKGVGIKTTGAEVVRIPRQHNVPAAYEFKFNSCFLHHNAGDSHINEIFLSNK